MFSSVSSLCCLLILITFAFSYSEMSIYLAIGLVALTVFFSDLYSSSLENTILLLSSKHISSSTLALYMSLSMLIGASGPELASLILNATGAVDPFDQLIVLSILLATGYVISLILFFRLHQIFPEDFTWSTTGYKIERSPGTYLAGFYFIIIVVLTLGCVIATAI